VKEIVLVLVTAVAITLCIFSTPWAQGHGPGGSGRPALKVALLPILDSLPFHAAEETGTFRELGVEVKIIPVASAIERDQLMQSGQIDGMLTEMNTAASFNRDAVGIRIVRFARVAYPHHPLFRILSSPQSGIRSAAELPGVGIGVAKNTVIEYVTDRLLAAKGLKPEQIVKQSVPIIPERFQLLLQGRIKAAVLPDPLAKSAMVAGAAEVAADSEYPEVGVSVLAFSVDALRKKGEAVRLFLEGWDRAAGWINGHPEESRAVLLKRIPMPDNVREGYRVPPYPGNGVPDRRQWSDVIRWMEEKRLLDKPISYEDSVTTDYLKHPAVRPAS
jgi:NitT/TauT family transport system substrate-binding protein